MIIEVWRKLIGTEYRNTCCSVCGNDFDRGSVFPVIVSDKGTDLGEMCLVCLEYLTRRKNDEEDPTLNNWPASQWPTVEDVEALRRRYPEPMFEDDAAFALAAPDFETEEEIARKSTRLWVTEPEVL